MSFLYLLALILLPPLSFGQIVTSSFDRSVLNNNPASGTTRGYSQVALSAVFRATNSDIEEERPTDEEEFKWNEDIDISKNGVYFTGHGRFAPELYLSKDVAKKTLQLENEDQKYDTKVDMLNNYFNLGWQWKNRIAFGIKAYFPSYDYKDKFDVDYGDGSETSFEAEYANKIKGMGAGITYGLGGGYFLGGYYTHIKEDSKAKFTYTDSAGTPSETDDSAQIKRKHYGLGFGFLKGGRGRGMRMEVAYSILDSDIDSDMKKGSETYAALEFSHRLITAGVNVKMRSNIYFENYEIIDYIVGDKIFTKEPQSILGFFVSLGRAGKGHAFGISGYSYTTSGKKKLFEQDQDAKTRQQQYGLNYAYLF